MRIMTDRVKAYLVVLEIAYREDRAQPIEDAIRMIKGVEKVEPYIAHSEDYAMYQQGFFDARRKIYECLASDPDLGNIAKNGV